MKILVGYDHSKASKAALDLAITHAKAFNASVELVHSLNERTDTDYSHIDDLKKLLNNQQKKVVTAGVPCEIHLLSRDLTPGEDLVRFAVEEKVDEIIIGVKRRSKLEKLIFGSNARYVILNAQCPVVAVK